MSIGDLGTLEEAIAILSDTAGVAALNASEDELARGEVVTEDELKAVMAAGRRSAP